MPSPSASTKAANKTSKKPKAQVAQSASLVSSALFSETSFVKIWAIIGAAIVLACVLWVIGILGPVLLFLAVGCIMAFICSPIVNFLERYHIPRGAGSALALVFVLGVCAAVVGILGPLFVDQLVELLTRVPIFSREIMSWLTDVMNQVKGAPTDDMFYTIQRFFMSFSEIGTRYANEMLEQITNGILPNIMNTASNLFVSFLGIVLAFWLAKDYPKMMKEFVKIAGPKHRDSMTLLFAVTSKSVSGYMKGIVITSIFGGVLAWIGFMLVGQPYAALMGILTAILHFIPVVGPFISAGIATATAFFISPMCALWTLIVAIIAENITDNVLSPVVMKTAVRVHPAMSLLAIVIGYVLGGGVGMAISIPVSAAIKGVFIYYFETKTQRQLVSPEGALFEGRSYVFENGLPAPSFDALDDDSFFLHSKLVVPDEQHQLKNEREHLKKSSSPKRERLAKLWAVKSERQSKKHGR